MSAIEIAKLQKERKVSENSILQLNIFMQLFEKTWLNLLSPNLINISSLRQTLRTFITLILAIIESIVGCATEEKKKFGRFSKLFQKEKNLAKTTHNQFKI